MRSLPTAASLLAFLGTRQAIEFYGRYGYDNSIIKIKFMWREGENYSTWANSQINQNKHDSHNQIYKTYRCKNNF